MNNRENYLLQQQYIKNQRGSGLKIGDSIRITRIPKDYEDGWATTWPEYLTEEKVIGPIFEIKEINMSWGVYLSPLNHFVPYFICEKVDISNDMIIHELRETTKNLVKETKCQITEKPERIKLYCNLLYQIIDKLEYRLNRDKENNSRLLEDVIDTQSMIKTSGDDKGWTKESGYIVWLEYKLAFFCDRLKELLDD